jgi:precorrin-3B synthase
MATGDGLLARFAVARAVPLDAFAALCAAAEMHGNGIIEITSRGTIQIRGLTPPSAPPFATAVAALDIADPADGRVIGNPLAGLDPHELFDASEIAYQLRTVLIETGLAATLAPKVSVVIDGGGSLTLDAVPADIRLRAETNANGMVFHIALAGDNTSATPLCIVAPERAVETVLQLLQTIASRGRAARARDVLPLPGGERVGVRGLPAHLKGHEPPHPTIREQGRGLSTSPLRGEVERSGWIGAHNLRGGSVALGFALPFGHTDAETLGRLIDEARETNAASMRPAPGRALLVVGVAREQTKALASAADKLGFITKPSDLRRRVVACAGAPVCAAGEIPARALAPAITASAKPLLDRGATVHVSGCAKGCAHPGHAALTIVGIGGRCGIVPDGTAQSVVRESVGTGELPARIAALLREPAHG